jgi:hypothetical protein
MAGEIAALRKARSNTGAPKLTKSQEVVAMFAGPDVYIAGDDVLMYPVLENPSGETQWRYRSPFFIDGKSRLFVHTVDQVAFGFGFAILMAALDWIQLGVIPWTEIISDAMKLNKTGETK